MSFGPPPSIYTQSALSADKTRRRRRTKLLAATAVILTAVLSAGGWLLSSAGDDRAPADGKAEAVVQSPDEVRETVEKLPGTPEGQLVVDHSEEGLAATVDGDPRYAPGTWATGRILAKGVATRIEGYRIKPHYDETAWTLKLDGHICATSKHVTADGRTAVVVQPARRKGTKDAGICDEVVFLDLDTGKKLWQATMPAANQAYVTNTNLTLTRGVVAVAWGHGSVAYDMASGKRLWGDASVSQCEDTGLAGGRVLLALVACTESSVKRYEVQKLDPRTGRAEWTYKVSRGVQAVYLPSSDPPVLGVGAGDSTVTDLISLDENGKYLTTVPLDSEKYDPMCGQRYYSAAYFGETEYCDGLVVGRTQMYLASKDGFDTDEPANWILAFDLRTGRTVGKFDGRPLQTVHPLRMSGDDLLIYRSSSDNLGPAAVVSWNPRTDKETPFLLFNLPEDDEYELGNPEESDIIVEQGRVFFARRQLAAEAKYPKDPVLSVVGVGSAGENH